MYEILEKKFNKKKRKKDFSDECYFILFYGFHNS